MKNKVNWTLEDAVEYMSQSYSVFDWNDRRKTVMKKVKVREMAAIIAHIDGSGLISQLEKAGTLTARKEDEPKIEE